MPGPLGRAARESCQEECGHYTAVRAALWAALRHRAPPNQGLRTGGIMRPDDRVCGVHLHPLSPTFRPLSAEDGVRVRRAPRADGGRILRGDLMAAAARAAARGAIVVVHRRRARPLADALRAADLRDDGEGVAYLVLHDSLRANLLLDRRLGQGLVA